MYYLIEDNPDLLEVFSDPDLGIEVGKCWVDGGWVVGDDLEVSAIEQWFHGDFLVYDTDDEEG